ncbi:hypothetical protein DL96DRAFT_1684140 [Flagelloscypha sp. PMI_526]|nr:hypothetical protein DL96DRAFT_1684140 [Flagelloscypha sp. PMI_526]
MDETMDKHCPKTSFPSPPGSLFLLSLFRGAAADRRSVVGIGAGSHLLDSRWSIDQHDNCPDQRREYVTTSLQSPVHSESFPSLTHLMLPVDQIHITSLTKLFPDLKVLIFAIEPSMDSARLQAFLDQFPNVVFRDLPEFTTQTFTGQLEEFMNCVNGEFDSLWNQAETEIGLRVNAVKDNS